MSKHTPFLSIVNFFLDNQSSCIPSQLLIHLTTFDSDHLNARMTLGTCKSTFAHVFSTISFPEYGVFGSLSGWIMGLPRRRSRRVTRKVDSEAEELVSPLAQLEGVPGAQMSQSKCAFN